MDVLLHTEETQGCPTCRCKNVMANTEKLIPGQEKVQKKEICFSCFKSSCIILERVQETGMYSLIGKGGATLEKHDTMRKE